MNRVELQRILGYLNIGLAIAHDSGVVDWTLWVRRFYPACADREWHVAAFDCASGQLLGQIARLERERAMPFQLVR